MMQRAKSVRNLGYRIELHKTTFIRGVLRLLYVPCLRNIIKVFFITDALLVAINLTACSPAAPTTADIESIVLKETNDGLVNYTSVKVTELNCAESERKFNCAFDAHLKGKKRSLMGHWTEFEFDQKEARLTVTHGNGGWMQIAF